MTIEERIAEILRTSELDCCGWPLEVRMELAKEIVDGLAAKGWNIEHDGWGK